MNWTLRYTAARPGRPFLLSGLGLAAAVLAAAVGAATEPAQTPKIGRGPVAGLRRTAIRHPVAVANHGDRLLVGNRETGTVTAVDLAKSAVVGEYQVAQRLAHMIPIPGRPDLLVADSGARRLLRAGLHGAAPKLTDLGPLPADVARIQLASASHEVFLSSPWSRQVIAVQLDDQFDQRLATRSVQLPFAPRDLLLVDNDRKLLVADAFGGRLAVVDPTALKVQSIRELHGHNIRGLAVDQAGRLHIAHQQIRRTLADYEELHWGRMIANGVQVVDLADVITDSSNDSKPLAGWLDAYGDIGGAMADPSGVLTGNIGNGGKSGGKTGSLVAVALGGVNEVVVRTPGSQRRHRVGSGAAAMVVADGRLVVANRLDDSISVIDLQGERPTATIPLGPRRQLTAAERGERLFFDARLSHDGWVSCHSCHTDGHSNGLLVDTLGDGDYGAPKRIPSLLGTRGTGPWGWIGSSKSLDDQVRKSVTTTMHGDPLEDGQVADLVAYLKSLPSPPPRAASDTPLSRRGAAVFKERGCVECHRRPALTSADTFDVGLVDERKRRRFNPPSLRGVGQRHRLFHDGRAANLDEVLSRFRHQLDKPLADDDRTALLEYLRSL